MTRTKNNGRKGKNQSSKAPVHSHPPTVGAKRSRKQALTKKQLIQEEKKAKRQRDRENREEVKSLFGPIRITIPSNNSIGGGGNGRNNHNGSNPHNSSNKRIKKTKNSKKRHQNPEVEVIVDDVPLHHAATSRDRRKRKKPPKFQLQTICNPKKCRVPWWTEHQRQEWLEHHQALLQSCTPQQRKRHYLFEYERPHEAWLNLLDAELTSFASYVQISQEEIDARNYVVETVGNASKHNLDCVDNKDDVKVQVFGSFATRPVCAFCSDVDMALYGIVPPEPEPIRGTQTRFRSASEDTIESVDRVQKWRDLLEEHDKKIAEEEEKFDHGDNPTDIQGLPSGLPPGLPPLQPTEDPTGWKTTLKDMLEGANENDDGVTDHQHQQHQQDGDENDNKDGDDDNNRKRGPANRKRVRFSSEVKSGKGGDVVDLTAASAPEGNEEEDDQKPAAKPKAAAPSGDVIDVDDDFEDDKKPAATAAAITGSQEVIDINDDDSDDDSDSDDDDGKAGEKDYKTSGDNTASSDVAGDGGGSGSDFFVIDRVGDSDNHVDNNHVTAVDDDTDNGGGEEKKSEDDGVPPPTRKRSLSSASEDSEEDTADKLASLQSRKRQSGGAPEQAVISLSSDDDDDEEAEDQYVNIPYEDEDDEDDVEVSFVSQPPPALAASVGPQGEVRVKVVNALSALGNVLRKRRFTHSVQVIKHARVPIIKFNTRMGFEGDIAMGGHNGTDTSQFAKSQVEKFQSFATVVMALKIMLWQQNLDVPFVGGLGSYKLYVLVAYHLQRHLALGGSDRPSEVFLSFLFRYGQIQRGEDRLDNADARARTLLDSATNLECDGGYCASMEAVHRVRHCVKLFERCFLQLGKSKIYTEPPKKGASILVDLFHVDRLIEDRTESMEKAAQLDQFCRKDKKRSRQEGQQQRQQQQQNGGRGRNGPLSGSPNRRQRSR